ncbi:hypothetical protein, partial [Xanthomonas campestris]|uniref:hypothetical protein n=1 Tax=Xanthomonas campestris TaxID=339 RepID=UPI003D6EE7C5
MPAAAHACNPDPHPGGVRLLATKLPTHPGSPASSHAWLARSQAATLHPIPDSRFPIPDSR